MSGGLGGKTYNPEQMCALAGVRASTLRTWRKRGLVKVQKEHAGAWTLYTEADARWVCGLAALARFGIEGESAACILERLGGSGTITDSRAGIEIAISIRPVPR